MGKLFVVLHHRTYRERQHLCDMLLQRSQKLKGLITEAKVAIKSLHAKGDQL